MTTLDLDRYGERIGLPSLGSRTDRGTESLLTDVHLAHATSIPFENLDIHLGIPIQLEPERVFDKLVVARRGGYCFEQNTLLSAMLTALGFTVRPLAARVLFGRPVARPRTHMLLLVDIGGRQHIADVGFGVHNMLAPLPFEPGKTREVHGEAYRLTSALDVETRLGDTWAPLYRISLEEQLPIDFVMGSWFTSTHPESLFVKQKIVSRVAIGARTLLIDRELKVGGQSRMLADEAAYLATLREVFGIELPSDRLLRW